MEFDFIDHQLVIRGVRWQRAHGRASSRGPWLISTRSS